VFTGIPVGARPGGRAGAWVLRLVVAAGVIAIAVAWAEASNTVVVSEQAEWAPVALAGTTAVAIGLLASVLMARQAVALRLARLAPFPAGADSMLLRRSGAEAGPARTAAMAAAAGNGASDGGDGLVAGARMARSHAPTCPLTTGKAVRPASRTEHEQAGRRPCGICCP
jgi:NAD(P)H-hydrate repair Nnr-like enzyme with NAD(P)H-hydrate epimerase domain